MVLDEVPMREWVLSLPRWARFLLARNAQLITRTLDLALRTILTMQRRRGRRAHAKSPRTGAVTLRAALRRCTQPQRALPLPRSGRRFYRRETRHPFRR